MNEQDKRYLLSALAGVFEGFAFMFVEDEEEDDVPAGGNGAGGYLGAAIGFWGERVQGELELVAPGALCTELAENILGTDEGDLPEDAGRSALAEVLNVSCGYLLAEKYGVEEVFNLSIPATRAVGGEEWTRLGADRGHVAFTVDEAPLLARLTTTEKG